MKILSLLGFAQNGGKVVSGSNMVERQLPAKMAGRLVLIARDATAPTADRVIRRCRNHAVPVYRIPVSMQELGQAIGKNHRGYVMIKDSGFTRRIIAILKEMEVRPYE